MEAKLKETEAKFIETEEKLKAKEAKLTAPVQQPSQAISQGPTYLKKDGDSIVITMPKVSEHCRSRQVWHSPPFFYDKEGYKMCLAVNVISRTVIDTITGLTISIKLLQGEQDDKLRWPIAVPPSVRIYP